MEHQKHAIEKELLVIKATVLPFCPVCNGPIDFHLLEQVMHIDEDPDFNASEPE